MITIITVIVLIVMALLAISYMREIRKDRSLTGDGGVDNYSAKYMRDMATSQCLNHKDTYSILSAIKKESMDGKLVCEILVSTHTEAKSIQHMLNRFGYKTDVKLVGTAGLSSSRWRVHVSWVEGGVAHEN